MASVSEAPQAVSLPKLPAAALKLIAQELDPEDKKNLALTSKTTLPIIRSLWQSIVIDLASRKAPPRSLAKFCGVTNFIIADSALGPIDTLNWDDYEEPDSMPLYKERALSRVSQTVSAIWGTTSDNNNVSRTPQPPREISLQIAIPSRQKARKLVPLLKHAIPDKLKHFARNELDQVTEALENVSTSVAPPAVAEVKVPAAAGDDEHARSPTYPFIDVDAGWFYPDGELTDVITKGTVSWYSKQQKPESFKLELYKKIHTLRVCVCMIEEFDGGDVRFSADTVPKLNALPLLRELHLGAPDSYSKMDIEGKGLQLPGLTKLNLNEWVNLTSFSSLVHLSSLQVLEIAMPGGLLAFGCFQPQDLAALAGLKDLRSLVIDDWRVEAEQDMSALNQPSLTTLQFWEVHGEVNHLKPKVPMPNLKEFFFLISCDRTKKLNGAFQVGSWALGKAGAASFPNVSNFQLTLMGSETSTDAHRDKGVTTDQIHEMLANISSMHELYVQKVLVNVYAMKTLIFPEKDEEKFRDGKDIHDEIELVGDGGLKSSWKRRVSWDGDRVSQCIMMDYLYSRCG